MARVEDSTFQETVGWTLVGENAEKEAEAWAANPTEQPETSEYATAATDLLNERIAEQGDDRFVLGDEEADRLRSERGEQEPREEPQRQELPERSEQQEPEQTEQPTPERVQESIEKLDADVKEYGLNEPADARKFADEFCGAFGTDVYKAGVDVGALNGVMAKTALSALHVAAASGGDLTTMGEIPAQSAQAFAHELLKGMGIDPRSMNVDAPLLARTALGGMVNFIKTYYDYGGKVTDLAKLNDPRAAEFYMQNFMQALGVEGQVNRDAAIKFADACARQMLRVMDRLRERNAASQQQPRGRSQGQRVPKRFQAALKGAKAPRFQTNSGAGEPFSDEVMQGWAQQSGRL